MPTIRAADFKENFLYTYEAREIGSIRLNMRGNSTFIPSFKQEKNIRKTRKNIRDRAKQSINKAEQMIAITTIF
jgi:hypothetical protein